MVEVRPLPLFEYARSRASDPHTSRQAAASINTTPLEQMVVDAIAEHGPKTSFELADILGLSLVTVSPRLRPLADKGYVKDSGMRRVNVSRRKSIVWKLSEE